jgi:hypothetical protein
MGKIVDYTGNAGYNRIPEPHPASINAMMRPVVNY